MAISIDFPSKVITVPKADTTLVDIGPPEIRSLNVDTFRLALKDLEDDEDGMAFLHTHNHNPPVTVGGVTLARVVEIINGYTVTFENGSYAVNLEGANNNIGDVLNLNNVQIRSNNSAGLTFSKQVNDQSFLDGRVSIDATNGQSGTAFPLGTPGNPVDNLADAQTIISTRTLPNRLSVAGALTIGASDDLDGYDVRGIGAHGSTTITLTSGCSTDGTMFSDLDLLGTAGGTINAVGCVLNGVSNLEGFMVDCGLLGTLTLVNTDAINDVVFVNCHSGIPGTTTPIIDANSVADLDLNIVSYHGGIEIRNFTLSSMVSSINIDAGNIILASSNTDGTIVIRGVASMTDNSTGTTVIDDGLVRDASAADAWSYIIETGFTAEEMLRLISASAAGKLSGAGTTNIKIRDLSDTKDRIDATVDASGNRTVVTLDDT